MHTSPAPTTGLLLAAGAGTRLGRGPKVLLPFRGRTLVEALAGELRAGGCAEVTVVLGAGAEVARRLSGLQGCNLVENPRWRNGMGSSFQVGVASTPGDHHVLVALVDQPGVGAAIVERLLGAHWPGRVTASGYRGSGGDLRRGHHSSSTRRSSAPRPCRPVGTPGPATSCALIPS